MIEKLIAEAREQATWDIPESTEILLLKMAKALEKQDKFFAYLAETFSCPCNFSPLDEEMWEFCEDTCQNDITECWRRVAKMVAKGVQEDD